MMSRLLRLSAWVLVLGALLAATAPPPGAAQPATEEEELRAFVEGLQNGTLPSALAIRECERDLAAADDAEDVRQFMAGYLDVPDDFALGAFCAALVRAIRNGELSAATVATIGREQMDAEFFFEFGRILRASHFSHHLTTTASAARSLAP